MRILVTGASGFIGARFCRTAVLSGHQVAGISRQARHIERNREIAWIEGSISDCSWSEIQSFKPEVLVHLAWILTPKICFNSPLNESFFIQSTKFIERAVDAGVHLVVVSGTCVEYQITGSKLSEHESPLTPLSLYAINKVKLLDTLSNKAARGDFKLIWGRIFYPYGPGEHPQRLCSGLLSCLANNKEFFLNTPQSTKDYIHIEDLTAAILATLDGDYEGIINWGTGTGITVKLLAEKLAKLVDKSHLITFSEDASVDPLAYVVADNSILKSLGWRQKISIDDGLASLVNHFNRT